MAVNRAADRGLETTSVSNLRSGVVRLMDDGAQPFVKDLRNFRHLVRAPFLSHRVTIALGALVFPSAPLAAILATSG